MTGRCCIAPLSTLSTECGLLLSCSLHAYIKYMQFWQSLSTPVLSILSCLCCWTGDADRLDGHVAGCCCWPCFGAHLWTRPYMTRSSSNHQSLLHACIIASVIIWLPSIITNDAHH